ncbi:VanZ family protein [Streptomyces sp. NPDC002896]|uniref:VanZ family protein n=1 Tax=Streptomyces sp. NPDC002896 TaxID=3154438 RepID=UPI003316BB61
MGNASFRIESVEVLGPLLAAFAVLLAARASRKRPGWYGRPALTRLVAAGYVAGFLHFTIFPIIVDRAQNEASWTGQVQPIPFLSVLAMDPTVVLNVILFVPFGLLLPLIAKGELSVKGVALRSLAVSLTIELTQLGMYILFSNGRGTDVDDLIANTLGGVLGYLILRRVLRSSALSGLVRDFALPGTALAASATETVSVVAAAPGAR